VTASDDESSSSDDDDEGDEGDDDAPHHGYLPRGDDDGFHVGRISRAAVRRMWREPGRVALPLRAARARELRGSWNVVCEARQRDDVSSQEE